MSRLAQPPRWEISVIPRFDIDQDGQFEDQSRLELRVRRCFTDGRQDVLFFFFGYPREMLLRIPAGGTAGYVELALFNEPYPLKPSEVSGTGVTGGGSESGASVRLSDPPPAAGRVWSDPPFLLCSIVWSRGRGHHPLSRLPGGEGGNYFPPL